jgi:hypothetical protein
LLLTHWVEASAEFVLLSKPHAYWHWFDHTATYTDFKKEMWVKEYRAARSSKCARKRLESSPLQLPASVRFASPAEVTSGVPLPVVSIPIAIGSGEANPTTGNSRLRTQVGTRHDHS